MTALDYAVLGVMAISIAWGIWRGLVHEIVSLAGWVIAFLAANLFAGPFAKLLPDSVPRLELKVMLAFIGIFLVALVLTTLAGVLLSKLTRAIGLGGLDRTLGALFGVARGLLLVLAFTLVCGLTRLPLQPFWKSSFSGPVLGNTATMLKPWLPPALADRLRYH